MAYISMIPDGDATGELRELYDNARDPHTGGVDNIMRIHSLHPAGLRGHFELYRAVMAGSAGLRRVDRELVAVVVSQLNGCGY
jgi:alkylhydroperoxidase family enzyme